MGISDEIEVATSAFDEKSDNVALTMKAQESARKCDARSEFTKLVTPFVYFLVSIRVVVISRPRL